MEISDEGDLLSLSEVPYLALNDLQARWIYTRQGVHKLVKSKDFPAPVFIVNCGKTRIWSRVDVEAFERVHPELFDVAKKQLKMTSAIGFRAFHKTNVR